MTIKIIKLIIIFIACIPFYILIDFISCMLITEGFSVENAFRNSTAFAVTWTGIIGYKWFKKEKKK